MITLYLINKKCAFVYTDILQHIPYYFVYLRLLCACMFSRLAHQHDNRAAVSTAEVSLRRVEDIELAKSPFFRRRSETK